MQKSKTKFVHARGEKSHLKRTFLAPLTRLIILLIYKKKQAVLTPKIGCFFLQKHRFSFPKAIFNFVKITHLPDKSHLEKNNLVKPHEAYKRTKRNLNIARGEK